MKIQVNLFESGHKTSLECTEGLTLKQILDEAGVFLSAPCAGNGRCGKCRVMVRGRLTRPTPEELRHLSSRQIDNGWRLACVARAVGPIDLWVGNEDFDIPDEKSASIPFTNDEPAGLAIDLGTTTIALQIVGLTSGELFWADSFLNPQAAYGADVLSRILFCGENTDGLKTLRQRTMERINTSLAGFYQKSVSGRQLIKQCVVAGNTAMLHIFTGINPAGLAQYPYQPVRFFGESRDAKNSGLDLTDSAQLYFPPCVSGFVGADITAGLLATGLLNESGPCLFVDLGTNGEMALSVNGRITCCSAAAGPAFEGAHISHGTGSIPGAICGVWVDGGRLRFETIADREPTGICGTGLIDAAATLLRLGMIDRSGRINPDRASAVGETPALVIDGKSGIVLTQKDIREIQLAKAAVAAGIETLLDSAGIQPEEIEKVYLSGGFGSRMHPDEAKEIGLFQKNLKRITACGNTSLTGAVLLLSDDRYRENIREVSRLTGYLELSDSDFFNERFIENISF